MHSRVFCRVKNHKTSVVGTRFINFSVHIGEMKLTCFRFIENKTYGDL